MSKAEAIHELYEICKSIDFEEVDEITAQAKDKDEKEFYRVRSLTQRYLLKRTRTHGILPTSSRQVQA